MCYTDGVKKRRSFNQNDYCISFYYSVFQFAIQTFIFHRRSRIHPKDTWRKNSGIITSNDVATSFWRNNDVIISSSVRCAQSVLAVRGVARQRPRGLGLNLKMLKNDNPKTQIHFYTKFHIILLNIVTLSLYYWPAPEALIQSLQYFIYLCLHMYI